MKRNVVDSSSRAPFRIGDWEAHPRSCRLVGNGTEIKLSPRSMDVLAYLADRPGVAVTHDELLDALWRGTIATRNAIQKCVVELRHAFGNGGAAPTYIETVPKRGYRVVAKVESIHPSSNPRSIDDSDSDANGTAAIDRNGVAERPTQRAADAVANAGTLANANAKSIAVLRFRRVSSNPDDEYLAEGLAGALYEALRQASDLSVTERGRSFQRSIANETVQAIGRDLGVEHLLEGSVQQLHGHLRISVALYRCSNGARLFAFRDEQPVGEFRKAQARLIANVLTALEVHLDERRAEDMRKWGTQNVDAYLAALDGDAFHIRLDRKSLLYAVERFRAAIQLDPGFVQAYRLLAFTMLDLHGFSSGEARRMLQEQLAQLREAVRRIPRNFDALTAIDICERRMGTRSWHDLEADARAAIQEEGAPYRAFSEYLEYARLLKTGHLFREASRYVDLYARFDKDELGLDTDNHRRDLAALTLGPQLAIPMEKKSLTVFQNNVGGLSALVTHLALIGDYKQAEAYLARLEENDHAGSWAFAMRLRLAALRGELPAGSEKWAIALEDSRVSDYLRGVTHFILGDVDAGVEAWRRMRGTNNPSGARSLVYAVHAESCYTASVVNDPRYQDVLDELGIGRRWTAYLREKVAELAPITGIEPSDSTPQAVFLNR